MGTHPIFESDFDCLTVQNRMDSQIKDLLDGSDFVTFTDVANELQVHVNKAKTIIKDFAKASSDETVYFLSGVANGQLLITLARGSAQRKEKVARFSKIFSHHVYGVAKKDYDFAKRQLEQPVPAELGIRDIPPKVSGTVKKERVITTENVDVFKKKAPAAKPIAKAFAKQVKKEATTSPIASTRTTTNNSVVESKKEKQPNNFFGAKEKTSTKKASTKKEVKKEPKPVESDKDDFDEDMETDEVAP